jgi:hypothetical protein
MADLPSSGSDSEDDRRPPPKEAARLTHAALKNSSVKCLPPKKRKRNESDSDFSAGSDASEDSEEESARECESDSESDNSISVLVRRPAVDTPITTLLRRMANTLKTRVFPLLPVHEAVQLSQEEDTKSGIRLVEARFDAIVRVFENAKSQRGATGNEVAVLDFMEKMVNNVDVLHRCVSKFRDETIRDAESLADSFQKVGDYSSP